MKEVNGWIDECTRKIGLVSIAGVVVCNINTRNQVL